MYAHTGNSVDRADWEPLAKHLAEVRDMAAAFAGHFGAAEIASAMGALHDVGKAKAEFQRYLIESCAQKASNSKEALKSPGHSTEGAVIARERYGALLGQIMAFGVAGHHAGLPNGGRAGENGRSLRDRLSGQTPIALPADCDLAPKPADVKLSGALQGFTKEFSLPFLIRMLFSCLIDADRLATERYTASLEGAEVERGHDAPLEGLRDRLTAHLAGKSQEGPVNQARARILNTVRERAVDLDPGLFSLTVPTGGGKTLASLAFALDHAIKYGLRRIIYVIPYTSVVEQTAQVFREALGDDDAILEHHSAFDAETFFKDHGPAEDFEGADGVAKLRRDAQNWDRPIIVTTAVQFFESLYAHRPSKCRKLHNIAKSVVILDEAQTIPLPVLRPCLAAIQELARGYRASVVLCTATQPAVRAGDGFKANGLTCVRELAPDPEKLYRDFKRVVVRKHPEPLGDDDLAARMTAVDQALCIVNTRRHALDLYRLLNAAAPDGGVFHLSTRMCAAHRSDVLAVIKNRLAAGLPTRVVSTSLVEAGVDFDFPLVLRASAGLESVVQAAGRCNREGKRAHGEVVVFEPAPGEGRNPQKEMKQFVAVAEGVMKAHDDPITPAALTAYFKELYWARGVEELDAVKIGEDKGVLEALKESTPTKGNADMAYPFADIGAAFRLIEDVQVPVIVPHDKEKVAALIGRLHGAKPGQTGGVARDLQRHIVQLPRKARASLIAKQAAEAIRPAVFGDQFILLTNNDLYTHEAGLDWDDPTFRSVTNDMF